MIHRSNRIRLGIGIALCTTLAGCFEDSAPQVVTPVENPTAVEEGNSPAIPVVNQPNSPAPQNPGPGNGPGPIPSATPSQLPSQPPQSQPSPLAPEVSWSGGSTLRLVERFPSATPLRLEVSPSTPIDGCSISPRLPSGLSFDSRECRITGAPDFVSAPQPYTITAWNLGGEAQVRFELSVLAQPRFLFLSKTAMDRTWNGTATRSHNLWISSLDGRERRPLTQQTGRDRNVDAFVEVSQDRHTGYGKVLFRSTQGLSGITDAEPSAAANLWTLEVQPETQAVPFTVETQKERSIREFRVTADQRSVIFVGSAGGATPQAQALFSLPVSQSLGAVSPTRITSFGAKKTQIKELQLSREGSLATFLSDAQKAGVFHLYQADLTSRTVSDLTPSLERKSESIVDYALDRDARFVVLKQDGRDTLISLDLEGALPAQNSSFRTLPLSGGGALSQLKNLELNPQSDALLLLFADRLMEAPLRIGTGDSKVLAGELRLIAVRPDQLRSDLSHARYDSSGEWILYSSRDAIDPITGSLGSDSTPLRSNNLWVTPSGNRSGTEYPGLVFPRAITRNTGKNLCSY